MAPNASATKRIRTMNVDESAEGAADTGVRMVAVVVVVRRQEQRAVLRPLVTSWPHASRCWINSAIAMFSGQAHLAGTVGSQLCAVRGRRDRRRRAESHETDAKHFATAYNLSWSTSPVQWYR